MASEAKKSQEATTTAASVQINSGTKISDWSLAEKHKVLEMIKCELSKLKVSLSQLGVRQQQSAAAGGLVLQEILSQQQQIKDRYILLVKKQSELQVRLITMLFSWPNLDILVRRKDVKGLCLLRLVWVVNKNESTEVLTNV